MNFYEVSTHISLFGSISEIRESDLQNLVVLNTGTVGTSLLYVMEYSYRRTYDGTLK
jgi:hypothetical protein